MNDRDEADRDFESFKGGRWLLGIIAVSAVLLFCVFTFSI